MGVYSLFSPSFYFIFGMMAYSWFHGATGRLSSSVRIKYASLTRAGISKGCGIRTQANSQHRSIDIASAGNFPPDRIRNIGIIAHIDAGSMYF